ncbi:anti sigma factor C-terminal domain-containing protein [Clostridium sp. MSJ-11]|uniref:Anti sigma factor C-terminal domain-containing protein n=1 Tax=Clostridium mobile TaxID=2841512 RepID=A0ABS6EHF2_9CLOT|nr:anti sigma factor C-terminal domain-containing protein [Clostridium mobile]MBU5484572.1 anti sigma factor C-terminal domain-containing protein [Clostridium mobile]
MKYRELLERYKKGLVSEEERQMIEEDIEKYEAIEEHLSEIVDMDLINFTTSKESEQHNEEIIKIKKSVNSRLRKVVFTSVFIMMTLLIGIFFIISPLVDSFFYDPAKVTVGEVNSDINFDIYALTELNMPGYSLTSDVYVDREGFGEYDIGYFLTNLFTHEKNYITTKIKRGEKIKNYTEIIQDIGFNFMGVKYPIGNPNQVNEDKQRVMNHIIQLNPVSYVSANLIFEEDLTMDELRELEEKYPNIDFIWAGIRTDPNSEMSKDLIGINLINSNKIYMAREEIVEEKYPAFHILEWLVNPTGYESGEMSLEAKAYELHYKSLLQYMIDREEATNVLDRNPRKLEYYKSALNYTKDNGVKTFGVLVYANAKDLIELVKNESIKLLELNQVLASKRYIN